MENIKFNGSKKQNKWAVDILKNGDGQRKRFKKRR